MPNTSDSYREITSMSRSRVYIVHGYLASPQDHWFPWLETELAKLHVQATTLPMPRSDQPHGPTWARFIAERIQAPDEHTYFVGHSLGCICILRYLETLRHVNRVGGLILVSGFIDRVEQLPQLDEFTADKIDAQRLIDMAPRRTVVASTDDSIVPYVHSATLAQRLEAKLCVVRGGGHFLASDGFTEFPEVMKELTEMVGVA